MKANLYLLTIILLASAAIACTTPADNMTISASTALCSGSYSLPNGLVIGASGITLDCNSSYILGSQDKTGIYIANYSNVTIKNCRLANYTFAINARYADNILVYNNTAGISGTGVELYYVTGSVISDNRVTTSSSAIMLHNSEYNNILFNTLNSTGTGGYAVHVIGSGNNLFFGNTLINNSNGIEVYQQSPGLAIVYNNINSSGYDIANNQQNGVLAYNNYWALKIYDYYDNSSLGLVNYSGQRSSQFTSTLRVINYSTGNYTLYNVRIMTSQPSVCKYSTQLTTTYSNGTQMQTSDSYSHYILFNTTGNSTIYYKCNATGQLATFMHQIYLPPANQTNATADLSVIDDFESGLTGWNLSSWNYSLSSFAYQGNASLRISQLTNLTASDMLSKTLQYKNLSNYTSIEMDIYLNYTFNGTPRIVVSFASDSDPHLNPDNPTHYPIPGRWSHIIVNISGMERANITTLFIEPSRGQLNLEGDKPIAYYFDKIVLRNSNPLPFPAVTLIYPVNNSRINLTLQDQYHRVNVSIITDLPATCEYSPNQYFIYGTGIRMSSADSISHYALVPAASGSIVTAYYKCNASGQINAQSAMHRFTVGTAAADVELYLYINDERVRSGVPILAYNTKLNNAATNHSFNMMTYDFFNHTDPTTNTTPMDRVNLQGYYTSALGETLAANSGGANGYGAFMQWNSSSEHRAVMNSSAYADVGIGVVYGHYDYGEFANYSISTVYTADYGAGDNATNITNATEPDPTIIDDFEDVNAWHSTSWSRLRNNLTEDHAVGSYAMQVTIRSSSSWDSAYRDCAFNFSDYAGVGLYIKGNSTGNGVRLNLYDSSGRRAIWNIRVTQANVWEEKHILFTNPDQVVGGELDFSNIINITLQNDGQYAGKWYFIADQMELYSQDAMFEDFEAIDDWTSRPDHRISLSNSSIEGNHSMLGEIRSSGSWDYATREVNSDWSDYNKLGFYIKPNSTINVLRVNVYDTTGGRYVWEIANPSPDTWTLHEIAFDSPTEIVNHTVNFSSVWKITLQNKGSVPGKWKYLVDDMVLGIGAVSDPDLIDDFENVSDWTDVNPGSVAHSLSAIPKVGRYSMYVRVKRNGTWDNAYKNIEDVEFTGHDSMEFYTKSNSTANLLWLNLYDNTGGRSVWYINSSAIDTWEHKEINLSSPNRIVNHTADLSDLKYIKLQNYGYAPGVWGFRIDDLRLS